MQSDLPHTLLRQNGSGGGGESRFVHNPNDSAYDKQAEALRRAQERRAAKQRGDGPYTMTEIFK